MTTPLAVAVRFKQTTRQKKGADGSYTSMPSNCSTKQGRQTPRKSLDKEADDSFTNMMVTGANDSSRIEELRRVEPLVHQ